jgi:hypothetical protein
MLILGIETSCDETGLALYDSERGLLAHALHSQIALARRIWRRGAGTGFARSCPQDPAACCARFSRRADTPREQWTGWLTPVGRV